MGSIRVERDDQWAVLTLARPERRNALSRQMMAEVTEALEDLKSDRAVRAIILAADGNVFSSGHDLSELTGKHLDEYREIFGTCVTMMEAVQSAPQPVIAEVQGLATAAGCQLVAACDLAVAAEDAGFATPGVKIGLFCSTPMVPLVRAIGRKRALEMLLTGRVVPAQEALAWGLINRVVSRNELRAASRQLAASIAEASQLTVSVGKRAFYAQVDLDQKQAYSFASETMCINALFRDAQEGMGAFLEKRKPVWRGE